jgi:hypothetical protein
MIIHTKCTQTHHTDKGRQSPRMKHLRKIFQRGLLVHLISWVGNSTHPQTCTHLHQKKVHTPTRLNGIISQKTSEYSYIVTTGLHLPGKYFN